jgi:hypothetical protein
MPDAPVVLTFDAMELIEAENRSAKDILRVLIERMRIDDRRGYFAASMIAEALIEEISTLSARGVVEEWNAPDN